jgi:hypothetical protein
MPRAERRDARADKVSGAIAVQVTATHHFINDVGFLPTEIKFIADLMSGNDRGFR